MSDDRHPATACSRSDPGIGRHALPVATALGANGRLDALDVP